MNQTGLFDYKIHVTTIAGSLYGIMSALLRKLRDTDVQKDLINEMDIATFELGQFREKVISDLMAGLNDEAYKQLCSSRLPELYSLSNKAVVLVDAISQQKGFQNDDFIQGVDDIRRMTLFIKNSLDSMNNEKD